MAGKKSRMRTISTAIKPISIFVKYSLADFFPAMSTVRAAPVETADARNRMGRREEFQRGLATRHSGVFPYKFPRKTPSPK